MLSSVCDPFALSESCEVRLAPRCSVPNCERKIAGFLLAAAYCPTHFVAACNVKMNGLAKHFRTSCSTEAGQRKMRAELGQMADQVYAASLWCELFSGYERIRVLEILERLGLLFSKVRRSERIANVIDVQVVKDGPASGQPENTRTEVVSRHGATLRSSQNFRRGDFVNIQRLDMGSTARARVVWQYQRAAEGALTAVEIINKLDFWA